MFRRLIMAIFMLYMKYLLSSIQKIPGLFTWCWEGVKWARDLVSVRKFCGVGYMRGPFCYQAMSKLIIVKSMVEIIICLCVLCNCTKV